MCSIADNAVTGEPFSASAADEHTIEIALAGCPVLYCIYSAKAERGQEYWVSSSS